MRVELFDDRILIKLDKEQEETTKGGIIIPDAAKEKPRTGTVISVGSDYDLQKMVKIGDRVICSRYGGEEVDAVKGKDDAAPIVVKREDIIGIIRED